ncbi:MAG: methyltransferase domain-containing protein [Victivallales bacterium]|nr:methyltransferase domain-containing protein [Victivallales bacterium]
MNGKKQLISHLERQGFSEEIIKAFSEVPRENYVSHSYIPFAYSDTALPLTDGSTISQPSTIAFMLELLDLTKKCSVLEIGSGCGYVLDLIDSITNGGKIFGVEINETVTDEAVEHLREKNNIEIFCQDGKNGLPEYAPFDRIIISAACPELPLHLLEQVNDSGIIVASVKDSIFKITKQGNSYSAEEHYGFRFVPLV